MSCRPWIAYLKRHEPSRIAVRDGLQSELEGIKERLVSEAPEQVPGLQRLAQYLTTALKELDE